MKRSKLSRWSSGLLAALHIGISQADPIPRIGEIQINPRGFTDEISIQLINSDHFNCGGPRVEIISIAINKLELFVPRSVFADLQNARVASVSKEKRGYVLVIDGEDGADSYRAKIFFSAHQVYRRTVESDLIPGRPTQETTYKLRKL